MKIAFQHTLLDLLIFKSNNITITAINKKVKSIKSYRAFILEIGQNNQIPLLCICYNQLTKQ